MAKKTKEIQFSRLSKAKQRVEIAKDTIKWLNTPNIKIDTGSYLNIYNYSRFNEDEEANKHLNELKCKVCAKGALFLTHVDRFNNCSIEELDRINSDEEIRKRLNKHFPDLQLDMMECAFEMKVCEDRTRNLEMFYENTLLADRCIAFGQMFKTPKERLYAILSNIIDNNGTFKPFN